MLLQLYANYIGVIVGCVFPVREFEFFLGLTPKLGKTLVSFFL